MADADLLFLVPGDPEQRTGGYRYVSRLVEALNQRGTEARVQGLEGQFPLPDVIAETAMDSALADCPNGTTVVLDGLAMGGLPEVVEKHARRLRLVALVHHPLADETGLSVADAAYLFASESRALAAVDTIITTSKTTSRRLNDYGVSEAVVRTVEPGVDTVRDRALETPTTATEARPSGRSELQILCVAGLSPRKAQHQLIEALAQLRDLSWHCTLVGSTERDADYSRQLVEQMNALTLGDRITLAGELGDEDLARHYRAADLFVLPSLYEGYGMVIDEALAAALPVITTDGGALASTGKQPGIRQYPAGSVDALRDCLQQCLVDPQILRQMKDAVRQNAGSVRHWRDAAEEFEQALGAASGTRNSSLFDLGWLSLREPADHRARSAALLARVQRWVEQIGTAKGGQSPRLVRTVDLGAGAGSNGVYLSKSLPVLQHWTLMDQDPSLLARAEARLAPAVDRLDPIECNLDADNLSQIIPANTDLITASALIDLVSAPWLDALASAAGSRRAAVYIVLSYAGEFSVSPAHPDDGLVRGLVNEHQHGDKGSGAALGPQATAYLKGQLEALDYDVVVDASPWTLGGTDRKLQAALISGWCEAALEQAPGQQARIEQWQSARLGMAERGELAVQVDHQDLFARPKQPPSS